MRAGFAVEDGVALHFRATRLAAAVSSRPDGRAFRVKPARDGVVETPLHVTYLGAGATSRAQVAPAHERTINPPEARAHTTVASDPVAA